MTIGTGLEHSFHQANGLRFHVASEGEGDLILFIHGFPEFWYSWRHQLSYFGKNYLAVAPDMRGYNLTEKPHGVAAYAIQNLVADIRALSETFSEKKFTLVAHDWGGAAAWAFAMAHEDLLERLVIINAPHPALFIRDLATNEDQIAASQYIRFLRQSGAEEKIYKNDLTWLWKFRFDELEEKGVLSGQEKAAYREAWSQPGAVTGGLNWYRASNLEVPTSVLTAPPLTVLDPDKFRISIPTLVIWGEQDHALLPSLLDGLETYVENLTIKKLPEAGHWVVQEYPDTVNALIDDFIISTQS